MEAHEAAEEIREIVAEEREEREERHLDERFRRRVALLIAVMAAFLALAASFGQAGTKDEIKTNVDAADYRSTLDAQTLELGILQRSVADEQEELSDPGLPASTRTVVSQHLNENQTEEGAVQSDPAHKDGIHELEGLVHSAEEREATLEQQVKAYDLAEVLLQIAIVLASVSIIALSRRWQQFPADWRFSAFSSSPMGSSASFVSDGAWLSTRHK
jgi:Domain of unknown function (DUF4337)